MRRVSPNVISLTDIVDTPLGSGEVVELTPTGAWVQSEVREGKPVREHIGFRFLGMSPEKYVKERRKMDGQWQTKSLRSG